MKKWLIKKLGGYTEKAILKSVKNEKIFTVKAPKLIPKTLEKEEEE